MQDPAKVLFLLLDLLKKGFPTNTGGENKFLFNISNYLHMTLTIQVPYCFGSDSRLFLSMYFIYVRIIDMLFKRFYKLQCT